MIDQSRDIQVSFVLPEEKPCNPSANNPSREWLIIELIFVYLDMLKALFQWAMSLFCVGN